MIQISAGVAYLHELGIIHRDIAARNVLFHEDRVLISDFDLARVLPDEKVRISCAVVLD